MTNDPIHERASELLGPYASGELDGARRAELETHLKSCSDCRAELRALELLRAPQAEGLTHDEREAMRAEVWQASHPRPRSMVDLQKRRPPAGRRLAQVLGAAAVIALLAVSVAYLETGLGGGDSDTGGDAGSAAEGADQGRGALRREQAPADENFSGEADAAEGGGAGAEAAPAPSFKDQAGKLGSAEDLLRLAREEPLRSFAAYSTRDAERAGNSFLNKLADQAPDETVARAVRACGRRFVELTTSLPAVAATGRMEGRDVVVLGYARGQDTGLLDRFLIVVYEIGRCGQPVRRVGGRLSPP